MKNLLLKPVSSSLSVYIICLVIGVLLRYLIASVGFTFDLQSYEIVAKIVLEGGNVYQETTRYNYSPLWFLMLSSFYKLSLFFSDPFLVFRYFIVGILTITDIFISILFYKRKYSYSALLFVLSPISIIVTGYYSQFDNVALLIGMIAVLFYENSQRNNNNKIWLVSVLLLGLSISIKHILIFFPLWLAVTERNSIKRCLVVIIPLALFGATFIPYLAEGFDGIKDNVFFYRSFDNAPLWQQIIPDYLKRLIRKEFLFFGALFLGALLWIKHSVFDRLMLYTLCLVVFSYAIADHYFSIIVPSISLLPNIFFVGFTIIQTVFYIMIISGGEINIFNLLFDRNIFTYTWQVWMLFLGFVWLLYRKAYPKIVFRHVTLFLFLANLWIVVGIFGLSWYEDKKIKPIAEAIARQEYEYANQLYVDTIQRDPPFAGSRFYEKLSSIRYTIEYYRKYKHIEAKLQINSMDINWIDVYRQLQFMPKDFLYKEKVHLILEQSRIHDNKL